MHTAKTFGRIAKVVLYALAHERVLLVVAMEFPFCSHSRQSIAQFECDFRTHTHTHTHNSLYLRVQPCRAGFSCKCEHVLYAVSIQNKRSPLSVYGKFQFMQILANICTLTLSTVCCVNVLRLFLPKLKQIVHCLHTYRRRTRCRTTCTPAIHRFGCTRTHIRSGDRWQDGAAWGI